MEPRIDRTQFGSVTIDGEIFTHDVIIRLGGRVEKRKKKLSKAVYGTSHTISLAEAEGDPGLEPGRRRRDRVAPRDLLRSSLDGHGGGGRGAAERDRDRAAGPGRHL
jgi:hypothetical protein